MEDNTLNQVLRPSASATPSRSTTPTYLSRPPPCPPRDRHVPNNNKSTCSDVGKFGAMWSCNLLADKRVGATAVHGAGASAELPAFVPILKRQKTLDEGDLPRCEWLLPSCSGNYSHYNELKHLCREVQAGLRCYEPILAELSAGGAYFMRGKAGRILAVLKPSDEEPFAANNPKAFVCVDSDAASNGGGSGGMMRKGIPTGEGAIREAAAFLIDRGFARCPPTVMVKAVVPKMKKGVEKVGSLQVFQSHLGSSDDFGPSRFNQEDVHRIAIMDIRLVNQDRHAGNILVCDSIFGGGGLGALCSSSAHSRTSSSGGGGGNNSKQPHHHPLANELLPSTPLGLRRSYSVGPGLEVWRGGDGSHPPGPKRADTHGLRLVPIDHGYSLPNPLHVSETELAWLLWPQSRQPLAKHLVEYVKRIDVEGDIAKLKSSLGSSLPCHCYLTLRIGTALLQAGVSKGLTLHDIGCFIVREEPEEPSKLELAIANAYTQLKEDLSPASRPGTNVLSCERMHGRFMSLLEPELEWMLSKEAAAVKRQGEGEELRVLRSLSA